MRLCFLIVLCGAAAACGGGSAAGHPSVAVRPSAGDSTWRDHVAAASEAEGNPARYRHHLERVHAELPGQPQVIWALARNEVMLRNSDSALAWLRRYADLGLGRDPAADSVLARLVRLPAYAEIDARLARNREPVDNAETAFTLHEADLIPEDITYDPARLNLRTGHPGISAPFDPYSVIEEVVRAYDVRWVVVTLEPGEARDALGLWDGASGVDSTGDSPSFLPAAPAFEAEGVRVYEVVLSD